MDQWWIGKLEVVAEKLRGDMCDQITEEMREEANLLCNQLQQLMLMFSNQHQVRISPNFSPKDQLNQFYRELEPATGMLDHWNSK